jgi:hypothetical protein
MFQRHVFVGAVMAATWLSALGCVGDDPGSSGFDGGGGADGSGTDANSANLDAGGDAQGAQDADADAAPGADAGGVVHFKAALTGTGSTTADARFSYEPSTGKLCGLISYKSANTNMIACHAHLANDTIPFLTFETDVPNTRCKVNATLTQDQLAKLQTAGTYVDVHGASNVVLCKGTLTQDSSATEACP